MAGHSKWANIKHKKAAADAKKGKVFSKIAKEIMVCARQGGGDPAQNFNLRTLIQKARGVNMPADNIDRAIKKGTGELDDGTTFEEVYYEGFAAGGVGILVHVVTDNRNRSAADVRHCFTKAGANLGGQGSVSRSFNRKGVIRIPAEGQEEDALMELALEAGAEDLENQGDAFVLTTQPNDYETVTAALESKDIPIAESELTLVPETYMNVTDLAQAKALVRFIDALEDLDDVQNVYTNMDLNDEIVNQLDEA